MSSLATPFAFHSEEGTYGNTMYAYLSFGAEDARAVEIGMNEIIADKITGSKWYRTYLSNNAADKITGSKWYRTYLSNNAENARAERLIGETVQLFINCFILITGAIADANEFNTLTNSIILRRREFAMLKSIGMGQRAFWRMIALECFSYAWRGLAIGQTCSTRSRTRSSCAVASSPCSRASAWDSVRSGA